MELIGWVKVVILRQVEDEEVVWRLELIQLFERHRPRSAVLLHGRALLTGKTKLLESRTGDCSSGVMEVDQTLS